MAFSGDLLVTASSTCGIFTLTSGLNMDNGQGSFSVSLKKLNEKHIGLNAMLVARGKPVLDWVLSHLKR